MTAGLRKIVVTGGAGYLGRALLHRLTRQSLFEEILLLDRTPVPPDPKVHFRRVELSELKSHDLDELLFGADVICHLAFAIDSSISDQEARSVNLEATERLYSSAARCKVRKFIMASSVSAYGAVTREKGRLNEDAPLLAEPSFRYAFHKALLERRLEALDVGCKGPELVRLRIATIMGPPERPGQVTSILSAPFLFLPRGFSVQFVHVDDVAEIFLLAMRSGVIGAFNVAAEPPLDGFALAELTGQIHVPIPDLVLSAIAKALGVFGVKDPGRIDFLRHPILVDSSRAQRELGAKFKYDGCRCVRALLGYEDG